MKEKLKKIFSKPVVINTLMVMALFVSAISVTGTFYVSSKLKNLPTIDTQYMSVYEPTKITDINGDTIWQSAERIVMNMEYEEIPEFYKDAIVIVEDHRFWESNGFSVKGIANMLFGVVRSKIDSGYKARGGSTIDQQLIKNKYYDGGVGHSTTTRKIQEIFLARQMNENFNKEEILTNYINSLEYAEGAVGAKSAMKIYFGKDPSDYSERTIENIAEQAYIAGLSQAPTSHNLYNEENTAESRTATILFMLKEKDYITEDEYNEALEFDLTTNLEPRRKYQYELVEKNLKYKAYTDMVLEDVRKLGYDVNQLSMNIQTFLDPVVYNQIENYVLNDIKYLDANQQVAVTVMDNDGVVVGMVGGRTEDEYNRAIQKTRSSGSALKPLISYAPLIQYKGNEYNTASKFDTSNYKYPGSDAVMRNYGQKTYGHLSMQESLRMSLNTPVARISDEILGSTRMKTFLRGIGLDVQDTYTSVDSIGIHVSTLQSAAAFNSLNNLGEYTEPKLIKSIEFTDESVLELEYPKKQVMNQSTAYVVNQMLKGVPKSGSTAWSAIIPQYEGYAGKTGTVGFDPKVNPPAPYGYGGSDAWYNSYTNEGYSISVWTGYDSPNDSPQIPDNYKGAQEVGKGLQLLLNKDRIPKDWKMPEGVEKMYGSGLNAHYKITDAKDIDNRDSINWTNLESYKELIGIMEDDSIDINWVDDLNSSFYERYKKGQLEKPDILTEEQYKELVR